MTLTGMSLAGRGLMSIQEDEHSTLRRHAKRKKGRFVKRGSKESKGVKAGQWQCALCRIHV